MIPILYEDRDLLVACKPVGVLSQCDRQGTQENMLSLLQHQLAGNGSRLPYVGLIHRLDRGVGGVMVFAKHQRAAGQLSRMVAEHRISKQYLAVIHGRPDQDQGELTDLLYKDASLGKSFVVDRMRKGVKEAKLSYTLLATRQDTPYGELSLIRVLLHTGRTHQIRVQFSSRRMPLVGDGKYGARDAGCPIGLWSYRLIFAHPVEKEKVVDVCAMPKGHSPFEYFSDITLSEEIL